MIIEIACKRIPELYFFYTLFLHFSLRLFYLFPLRFFTSFFYIPDVDSQTHYDYRRIRLFLSGQNWG